MFLMLAPERVDARDVEEMSVELLRDSVVSVVIEEEVVDVDAEETNELIKSTNCHYSKPTLDHGNLT